MFYFALQEDNMPIDHPIHMSNNEVEVSSSHHLEGSSAEVLVRTSVRNVASDGIDQTSHAAEYNIQHLVSSVQIIIGKHNFLSVSIFSVYLELSFLFCVTGSGRRGWCYTRYLFSLEMSAKHMPLVPQEKRHIDCSFSVIQTAQPLY
jgi:hypothetical protein